MAALSAKTNKGVATNEDQNRMYQNQVRSPAMIAYGARKGYGQQPQPSSQSPIAPKPEMGTPPPKMGNTPRIQPGGGGTWQGGTETSKTGGMFANNGGWSASRALPNNSQMAVNQAAPNGGVNTQRAGGPTSLGAQTQTGMQSALANAAQQTSGVNDPPAPGQQTQGQLPFGLDKLLNNATRGVQNAWDARRQWGEQHGGPEVIGYGRSNLQSAAPTTGTTASGLERSGQGETGSSQATPNGTPSTGSATSSTTGTTSGGSIPENWEDIITDPNFTGALKQQGFEKWPDGRIVKYRMSDGEVQPVGEDENGVPYGNWNDPGSYNQEVRGVFDNFAKGYKGKEDTSAADEAALLEAGKIDQGALDKANNAIRANMAQEKARTLRAAMEMGGRAGASADYGQGIAGDITASMAAKQEGMTNINNMEAAMQASRTKAQAAMAVFARNTDKQIREKAYTMAMIANAEAARQERELLKYKSDLENGIGGDDIFAGILGLGGTALSSILPMLLQGGGTNFGGSGGGGGGRGASYGGSGYGGGYSFAT